LKTTIEFTQHVIHFRIYFLIFISFTIVIIIALSEYNYVTNVVVDI